MNIDNCEFPDDIYYDVLNDVWFHPIDRSGSARMGVSSVFIFLSGKISEIKFRPIAKGSVSKGQSLAALESIKYVGAIRSPVNGTISKLNESLSLDPSSVWKSPYESWIAEYDSFDGSSMKDLLKGLSARNALLSRIKELHIRCFKLLPDEEMFSIGTECATTLANLDDLLEDKPEDYVVHLVTDDPTADIELVRWSMQTGNGLIETRKEENLYHFILRKVSPKKS
jgi:glycine cleavage system H protein